MPTLKSRAMHLTRREAVIWRLGTSWASIIPTATPTGAALLAVDDRKPDYFAPLEARPLSRRSSAAERDSKTEPQCGDG
jgi:hypothetical protein